MSRTLEHFRPLPPLRALLLFGSMLLGVVMTCISTGTGPF